MRGSVIWPPASFSALALLRPSTCLDSPACCTLLFSTMTCLPEVPFLASLRHCPICLLNESFSGSPSLSWPLFPWMITIPYNSLLSWFLWKISKCARLLAPRGQDACLYYPSVYHSIWQWLLRAGKVYWTHCLLATSFVDVYRLSNLTLIITLWSSVITVHS